MEKKNVFSIVLDALFGVLYIVAMWLLGRVQVGSFEVILMICAHCLFLSGFGFAEKDARGRIWCSFALYVFAQALFWYFVPETMWWRVWVTVLAYFLIGWYHTYQMEDENLFRNEQGVADETEKFIYASPNKKYGVWLVMSILSLIVAFMW